MKDTKVLNNKDVLVAPISTGMKFSVGLVENPSVFKFQLEKKISGMLFRVKNHLLKKEKSRRSEKSKESCLSIAEGFPIMNYISRE